MKKSYESIDVRVINDVKVAWARALTGEAWPMCPGECEVACGRRVAGHMKQTKNRSNGCTMKTNENQPMVDIR